MNRLKTAGWLLLFALGDYIAYRVGYALYLEPGNETPMWLANGVVLSALLLSRKKLWPHIVLIQAAVHFASSLERSYAFAAMATTADVLGPLFAASIIRRFESDGFGFSRLRSVMVFFCSILVAEAVASLLGALAVLIHYGAQSYWYEWQVWWFANVVGDFVIPPAILGWAGFLRTGMMRRDRYARVELFAVTAITIVMAVVIFGATRARYLWIFEYPFFIVPLFVWAAIRFHPRSVSTLIFVTAILICVFADLGMGPFVTRGNVVHQAVLSMQAFLIASVVTMLILSAVIQERRRAEEELKESESKYRLLVENQTDMVVKLDGNARFEFVSPSYCQAFGKTESDLIGETPLSFMNEDDRPAVEGAVIDILRPPHTFYLEIREKTKDGWKWMSWSGRAQFGENNELISVTAVGRDINERKQVEQELLRMRKLESVGILAGGIAHDFNNIMTGIIGNISMARYKMDDREAAERLMEEAMKAVERAKRLTGQLLTFSRGGQPIKETASIEDIITESAEFALRGANVRCEYDFPDDMRYVKVDPGQISQVVSNLVINANQAMPMGGIITIKAREVSVNGSDALPLSAGDYIKIEVHDLGVGIAPEDQDRVFDPYYTTKQEGSGLGLATSYSIVKKHGGHMTLDSVPGKGTTFCVYLPISEEEDNIEEEKVTVTEAPAGGRVLIMDDEEALRELASGMLESLGFDVTGAADGEEAINKYREAMDRDRPFNFVVMDLTVKGGMGGKEAMEKIREMDPEAKGIVASGYSNDPVMADHEKYGFGTVLSKPYDIDDLEKSISRLFNAGKD